MVSCPKATYETVEPILKHFGKLFYCGDKPGTAQTAKLGILPTSTYFISNQERDLKVIVADTQDPELGTVVLSDSL